MADFIGRIDLVAAMTNIIKLCLHDDPREYSCGRTPAVGDLIIYEESFREYIVGQIHQHRNGDISLGCNGKKLKPYLASLIARHGEARPKP